MRYVILIAVCMLLMGCATKQVPLDTSDLVNRMEYEIAIQQLNDRCIDFGDIRTEIERHRDECLHACDSK